MLSKEKEKEKILLKKELGEKSYKALLDVGGGTGELTKDVLYQFDKVDVVEPDKDFKKYHKKSNTSFHNTTIEKFKFTQKYDVIIASHVFPYIKEADRKGVLRRLVKRVGSGGKLIIFEMTVEGKLGQIKRLAYGKPIVSAYDTLLPYIHEMQYNIDERLFIPKFTAVSERDIMLVLRFFAEKELNSFKKRRRIIHMFLQQNMYDYQKKQYVLPLRNKMTVINL